MDELTDEERAEVELFEEEGEMSDGLFARAVVVGAAVGMPVVGVAVFVMFNVADIRVSEAGIIGLAIWSALWAGLLIGGVVGVGVKLLRLESKIHGDED